MTGLIVAPPPYANNPAAEEWIQEEGSLGEGFLTEYTIAERKRAMERAFRRELKQHRGNYLKAYQATLGKVQALERNRTLKRKYGKELRQIREWFVDNYGKGSKRWERERGSNPCCTSCAKGHVCEKDCRSPNPIAEMPGGSVSGCIEIYRNDPSIRDPGAYCASIADQIEPGWRERNSGDLRSLKNKLLR